MKVSNLLDILNRYKLSDDVVVMVDGVSCAIADVKRSKSDNIRYLNQSKLVLIPALPDLL